MEHLTLEQFMRWIGLLEAPKPPVVRAPPGGTWYRDREVPF